MSDVELKECPFCGPKGNPGYAGSEESGYTVQCFTCGTVGGWGDYGYQARDKWNTRTASASMGAKTQAGSRPLIRHYVDEHGNEMVALAKWFYDEMVAALEGEE